MGAAFAYDEPPFHAEVTSMPQKQAFSQASDFDPAVLKLFDQYVHGLIDRRGFLDGATRYATAGVSAAGLLTALSPQFAHAQKVLPTDPRIKTEWIEIASPQGNGQLRGYLVRPAKADKAKLPTVLVVHENRGLNPHIEDIARRMALDGFIAFAPDALFTLGGYPGDEDKARELFTKLDQAKTREDFVVAAAYLKTLPGGNGKLGVVGFCYGGGISNFLAARLPTLDAAVPFYGGAPDLNKVPDIKAELLLHFAGNDDRINATWPAYEAALKTAKVRYEAHVYAGAQHGFNNDTTPRYEEASAKLAWQRTLAFFNRTLASR
jgi:carboxymethylenebutenolidase